MANCPPVHLNNWRKLFLGEGLLGFFFNLFYLLLWVDNTVHLTIPFDLWNLLLLLQGVVDVAEGVKELGSLLLPLQLLTLQLSLSLGQCRLQLVVLLGVLGHAPTSVDNLVHPRQHSLVVESHVSLERFLQLLHLSC